MSLIEMPVHAAASIATLVIVSEWDQVSCILHTAAPHKSDSV